MDEDSTWVFTEKYKSRSNLVISNKLFKLIRDMELNFDEKDIHRKWNFYGIYYPQKL